MPDEIEIPPEVYEGAGQADQDTKMAGWRSAAQFLLWQRKRGGPVAESNEAWDALEAALAAAPPPATSSAMEALREHIDCIRNLDWAVKRLAEELHGQTLPMLEVYRMAATREQAQNILKAADKRGQT